MLKKLGCFAIRGVTAARPPGIMDIDWYCEVLVVGSSDFSNPSLKAW